MKRFVFTFFIVVLLISCEYGKDHKGRKTVDKPIVVLTFDDAPITDYTYVAPLLKKYSFGGTFFVCEFPLKVPGDSSKYMSWNQIAKLNHMGFEIGNHTHTHKHVNRMNKQEMHKQLAYIEAKCIEYGIPKPVSFAYPGYDTSSLALVVLHKMGYKYARAGGSRKYNPSKDNPLLIPSYSTTGTTEEAKKRVMNILENAKSGDIIAFTIHGVPDYDHSWVTTSPKLFNQYLEYMHDHHFIVIAMRDLGKYIN